MTIRVAILDDHRSFAQAISMALSQRQGIDSVGFAGSIDDFLGLVRTEEPDVLLVDYQLAGENGIDLAPRLQVVRRDIRMILLTTFASAAVATRAITNGFERVVGKEESVDSIADAVRHAPVTDPQRPLVVDKTFSRRQLEVLELMGQGLDPASIAETLFISVHTARSHVKDVLRALGASTQLAAVTKAIRIGYLLPPSKHDPVP